MAAAFLLRRMLAARPLLASVMLSVLATATLSAALASFATQAVPQAAQRLLASSGSTSITISGTADAVQARADQARLQRLARTAFGGIGYRLDGATWSDLLRLPATAGGVTTPITQAAALDRIREQAVLVAGAWPGTSRPGRPVPAAVPVAAAGRLHLRPGDVVVTTDQVTSKRIAIAVTGVFRPRNPAAQYWRLDLIARSGISVQQGFTTYGPMVVSPSAFRAGGLGVGQVSWAVLAEPDRIGLGQMSALAGRIGTFESRAQDSTSVTSSLQVASGLPALLRGVNRNVVVARSLLTIGALQLLLLAAAALALAGRLLAGHRAAESALLGARGATRWQLARPALAEALVVGGIGAAAGALAGRWLAALLVRTGPLRGSGLRLSGSGPQGWLAVAAVLALCTAITLWPALRLQAPGAVRAARGRQATVAGVARVGGDVALLCLAGISVWQLRVYSAVAQNAAGGVGVSPVLVLGPALALAGTTLAALRLLPLLAGVLERVTARGRRLSASLASWEVSRRPVRQSGPALLVILAVATGSLGLAQRLTWRQSAADQAAFATGADVRLSLPAELPIGRAGIIARAPGVIAAMTAVAVTTQTGDQVLAVDARHANPAVLLRPDLSPLPASELWHRISAGGPASGLALPGRPARLQVTARLSGVAGFRLRSVSVSAAIQDAAGIAYTVPAGSLPADGRSHGLTVRLSATGQASYPLRLLGLSLSYPLPPPASAGTSTAPVSLLISGIAVAAASTGPFAGRVAAGTALAGWRRAAASPELAALSAGGSGSPVGSQPRVGAWHSSHGAQQLTWWPGSRPTPRQLADGTTSYQDTAGYLATVTLAARPPVSVLPVIATSAFLAASNSRVGSTVPLQLGQVTIPARIAASVAGFPTVPSAGGLIADESLLQRFLVSAGAAPLNVTQWWLDTRGGAVPPGLPAGSAVTDRAARAAALLRNPLSATPQQATLAIAVAAALVAALGFAVSVAASMRERRAQSALLAALGVSPSAQSRQLCLEQLMLSLPAAAAGLAVGTGISYLVVPAMTLTASAAAPVPPIIVHFPFTLAAVLAAAIAAIPVLAAAATMFRRPDPAAQLRAAEAE